MLAPANVRQPKAPFTATRLDSTGLPVEPSCVAINGG